MFFVWLHVLLCLVSLCLALRLCRQAMCVAWRCGAGATFRYCLLRNAQLALVQLVCGAASDDGPLAAALVDQRASAAAQTHVAFQRSFFRLYSAVACWCVCTQTQQPTRCCVVASAVHPVTLYLRVCCLLVRRAGEVYVGPTTDRKQRHMRCNRFVGVWPTDARELVLGWGIW